MHGTLNDQSLIYLQIARMLEDDILRGVYREEEQVPSTNELARGYNINPATAAKGINLLVDGGIVYKKRGIGMFVASGAVQKLKEKQAHNCLLFTHHPGAQHEETEPPIYFSQEEKEFMKASGISHFNLHLPLDQINPSSPSISLAKTIGAVPYGQFFEEGGAVMGFVSEILRQPMSCKIVHLML